MALHKRQLALKNGLIRRYGRYLIIISLIGIIGLVMLQLGAASTIASSFETESGILDGAAAKINDSAASGGQSVGFGAVAAPTNIKAITGGNSIALIWNMPRYGVKNVEVYRNDSKVATVTPDTGVIRAQRLGTRYIDSNVTRGTTYQYKVRIIDQNNAPSPFSSVASATHPTNTTPVPTITIDASQAPDLVDYLNTYAKPEIETWYPKISDAIAYPSYTPISSFKLLMRPGHVNLADADAVNKVITVRAEWLRSNPEDGGGMFIHEATHILQDYPNWSGTPAWVLEGLADWSRDWFTRERFYLAAPNAQLGGYGEGGMAAQWADSTYSPGFIRKLNVAMHNGTYTSNFVSNLTGRTPDQLFAEGKQAHYGSTGGISNGAGKCLDIRGNGSAAGTVLQLLPCNGATGQRWTTNYRDAGLHGSTKKILHLINSAVAADGRCVDVYAFAQDSGSQVLTYTCNWAHNQQWVKQADGSLKSPYSNKCLSSAGDSSADGTPIVIATCNGSAAQRWTVPN